ncbi:uncharacterized protein LOC105281526 isoform X2 [Ooceraea biroi]|uniref:uncharacterized protein LOC105281526 isoform X2 n=1 Tax=Ooceraea biroi TaxID=2015173 RepID=UPI00097166D0|nr:uncharacterized protein LOC105281526 isoform X2 [Ooceraea biroi]
MQAREDAFSYSLRMPKHPSFVFTKLIPITNKFISGLIHPRSKWSPECLKLATQIRFAVGWKAYLYLKKDLRLPLPSYATVCRHINHLDFSPGMLTNIISLMEKKRKTHKSSHQSDCVLLMDEMDIQKTLEYDVSTVIDDL